nr:MAG TPA: hypothetical protein [Caudoviricetes sp.]
MRICHQRATYSGSRNAGAPTVLPICALNNRLVLFLYSERNKDMEDWKERFKKEHCFT